MRSKRLLRVAFFAVVAIHLFVVFGNIVSFFVCCLYAPWYVAFPCCSFVFFISTNPIECKLTRMENYIRRKLGMREIKGFVSHYLVKPFRRHVLGYGKNIGKAAEVGV